MNNLSKLFVSLAAVAMTACSSDEPAHNTGNEKPVGDVAYMTINISDVNSFGGFGAPSRAASTPDDFDLGSSDEHNVTSARFFFFDGDGKYVMTSTLGNPSFTDPSDNENKNIEYIGANNVLVLEGLTEKGYPSYVITVLNAPDFVCPETNMAACAEALQQYAAAFPESKTDAAKGTFVMSTSSYLGTGDKNHDDTYYYATKLDATDFYLTPEEATTKGKAVKIYVERLAAKVTLKVSDTLESVNAYDKDGKSHTLYKLSASLSGSINGDLNDQPATTTQLYVEFEGWTLNATAKESYLSKHFLTGSNAWDATANPWADWNEAGRHRSYWAKSVYYNNAAIAGDYASAEYPLNYVLNKEVTNAAGQAEYCYENTNTVDQITDASQLEEDKLFTLTPRVTHAVVRARVYTIDEAGVCAPVDMVNYNGLLFKTDSYKAYFLQTLKAEGKLNFYTRTLEGTETDGTYTYNQVDAAALALEADGTGSLGGAMFVPAEGLDLYYNTGEKDSKGQPIYKSVNDPAYEGETFAKVIDDAQEGTTITNYNGGESVYYIPVQHLNNADLANEGAIGVVRNHSYQMTISQFKNVGHGVFDPESDEVKVIPDEKEDPRYYLGVHINVLSWRIVNMGNIVL